MKSIEDLKKIRDKARNNMTMRSDDKQKYRVVVGMATCGIAAGARPVLNTLVEEVANNDYRLQYYKLAVLECVHLNQL